MSCDDKTGCPPDTHNLHCGYPDCAKGRADRASAEPSAEARELAEQFFRYAELPVEYPSAIIAAFLAGRASAQGAVTEAKPPSAPAVTEEMVGRALDAWLSFNWGASWMRDEYRDDMRAALTAALTPEGEHGR